MHALKDTPNKRERNDSKVNERASAFAVLQVSPSYVRQLMFQNLSLTVIGILSDQYDVINVNRFNPSRFAITENACIRAPDRENPSPFP
jgi:hypothetical protein